MKNIVLFDMDGTLTEPRKKINQSTILKIKKLSSFCEIGIVTGSGMDYLTQQLEDLWKENSGIDPTRIILMPCNGTIVYKWKDGTWKNTFSVSIREYLGEENFLKLFQVLISTNNKIVLENKSAYPLTGHFISFRNSLINFCPVGRNASDEDRKKFIRYDKTTGLRNKYIVYLKNKLILCGLTNLSVSLGGSTSFDIYPIGWDKTFSLNHFSGKTAWFVGDKCIGDGNDRKIYEKLFPSGKAFKTKSPKETEDIIDEIISSFIV